MMRTTLLLWVLVVVLRLSYALLAVHIDPFLRRDPLHGDAAVHDRIAWTLVSEGRYVYEKGLQVAPAYIWLIAGVYALMGHQPQAVRFVNALLGLIALAGLWVMCRRLFSERVANWTLLLAALHPHLLMITGWLYTENLMLPLLVWSVTLCVLKVSDSFDGSGSSGRFSWQWALVGLLLGLLALTRANFLPFIVLVALWVGWVSARRGLHSLGQYSSAISPPHPDPLPAGDTPHPDPLPAGERESFSPLPLSGGEGMGEGVQTIGEVSGSTQQEPRPPSGATTFLSSVFSARQEPRPPGWMHRRAGPQAATLLLLTACLTIAPYVLYLYARFGHFIPVGLGGYVFLWANNPEADGGFKPGLPETMVVGGRVVNVRQAIASPDPMERDRKALRLALQWIRENPRAFARLLWLKTRLSLSAFGLQDPGNRRLAMALRGADLLYWLYLLIALYGFVRMATARGAQATLPLLWLLLLLGGWVWLMIWVYAGGSRPMLPLQPYLVLGFVWGFASLVSRASQARLTRPT